MNSAYFVPSPCIRQCTLDDDDICVGCGRSLDDIKAWANVEPEQQVEIILKSKKRLAKIKADRSGA